MRLYKKLYALCSEVTETQMDCMIIALLAGLLADAVFVYRCISSWFGDNPNILLCLFLTFLFLCVAGFLLLMIDVFISSIPEDKSAELLLIIASVLFLIQTIAYSAFPFYLCHIHKQPLYSAILPSLVHLLCWIAVAIQEIIFTFAASLNPPDYEE